MENPRMCWICLANEATTGEHKYPAVYLRRIPNDWDDLEHGTSDGMVFHTQGPNSKNLKTVVLCADCNNHRTQRQDRALDAFLIRAAAEEEVLWTSRRVVLSFDHGTHDVLDLYRGLLKMEFSRLHDDGIEISPAISAFVAGGDDWRAANEVVRVEFRATERLRYLSLTYPVESVGVFYDDPFFISHQINFGWFGVHFAYAPGTRPDLPWGEWNLETAQIRPGEIGEDAFPAL